MTSLIGALLAAATILFVVSLPLGATQAGSTLRRWAGAAFLAALAPAVACSVLLQATGRGGGQPPSLTGVLAAVGLLAIISATAYVSLAVRGRIKAKQRRDRLSQERRGYQYDDDPRGGWWEGKG